MQPLTVSYNIKELSNNKFKIEGINSPYIFMGFIDNQLVGILSDTKINPEYRSFKNSIIDANSLPLSVLTALGKAVSVSFHQNTLKFNTCQSQ